MFPYVFWKKKSTLLSTQTSHASPCRSGHMGSRQDMSKAGVEEATGLYLQLPIVKGKSKNKREYLDIC